MTYTPPKRHAAKDPLGKYPWLNDLKPQLHRNAFRMLQELVNWVAWDKEEERYAAKIAFVQFSFSERTARDLTDYLVDVGLLTKVQRFRWKRGTTEPGSKFDRTLYVLHVGATLPSYVDKGDYSLWRRKRWPAEHARNAARGSGTNPVVTTGLGGGNPVVTTPQPCSDHRIDPHKEKNDIERSEEQELVPGTERVGTTPASTSTHEEVAVRTWFELVDENDVEAITEDEAVRTALERVVRALWEAPGWKDAELIVSRLNEAMGRFTTPEVAVAKAEAFVLVNTGHTVEALLADTDYNSAPPEAMN